MSDRKVAIVTGGSGGIGHAICERLLLDSYSVYIWSRSTERGKSAADSLHELHLQGKAVFQTCDVRSETSIKEAVADITQIEDHVNVLVNAAGILQRMPIADIDAASASDQINTLLLGSILATALLVPLLSAAGDAAVVNISSIAGRQSYPGLGVYGAAKAGIIHFSRSCARELLPYGIRVNCVCPGIVDTPLQSAAELAWLKSISPRNRIQKPQEIAEFIFEMLRFPSLTGAVIDLDDGVGLFTGSTGASGKSESVVSPPAQVKETKSNEEPQPGDATAKELSSVFTRIFGTNANEILVSSGPDDIARWDSLGHLRLIGDLEKTFGHQFTIDDVMQMTSFGAILAILKKK